MKKINIGDRVRFNGDFLRSICAYTGPMGLAKGTVIGINEILKGGTVLAEIDWDDPLIPRLINVCNLQKIRSK